MTTFAIDVKDRVVIVTGGAQGMGQAIAEGFASCGATVVSADLRFTEGTAGHAPSGAVMGIETDVTDLDSVERMVEEVVRRFGTIHVLINNAGIMYKSPIEEIDIKSWKKVLDVNLTGAVICTRTVVPHMKRQGWGRIINLSSMQALIGSATYSAYTATKAGLSGLTRVWAKELAGYGITVNAICPSYVKTPMLQKALEKFAELHGISKEEAYAKFVEPIPQKRVLDPEEIAFTALFLASPLALSITGHDLLTTAGYVMS